MWASDIFIKRAGLSRIDVGPVPRYLSFRLQASRTLCSLVGSLLGIDNWKVWRVPVVKIIIHPEYNEAGESRWAVPRCHCRDSRVANQVAVDALWWLILVNFRRSSTSRTHAAGLIQIPVHNACESSCLWPSSPTCTFAPSINPCITSRAS